MILAEEKGLLKGWDSAVLRIQGQIGDLMRGVLDDAGGDLADVEGRLFDGLLRIGRGMMEAYVAAQGDGDVGETVEHEGRTLRRLEARPRRYVSVFGELSIERVVYAAREGQKHERVPLDERLGLPEGDFSYLLQSWDQKFCVQNSFDRSRLAIEEILGIGQSVRSLEHMSTAMASYAGDFRQSQSPPPAEEEGEILVVTADGKGVPMKQASDQAGPTGRPACAGRRRKGEKANKKRMACVGAVYSIDRFRRTPRSVVDEVARHAQRQDRPAPRHKRVCATLTCEVEGQSHNGKDGTFSWLKEQVAARRVGDQPVACVMDGERALWKKLLMYLPFVICILDIFHVLERLWEAAHCFCAEGSNEARTFVTERLEQILCGKVGYVAGGLRQMATKRGLKGTKRKRLEAVLTYFDNNRRFMKYDQYLAAGYPIGSGVAEGACRHLVKDRMELTGMRWSVEGAQAMLDLRAIFINSDWDAFQKFRIEQEQKRLYPHKNATVQPAREAA